MTFTIDILDENSTQQKELQKFMNKFFNETSV